MFDAEFDAEYGYYYGEPWSETDNPWLLPDFPAQKFILGLGCLLILGIAWSSLILIGRWGFDQWETSATRWVNYLINAGFLLSFVLAFGVLISLGGILWDRFKVRRYYFRSKEWVQEVSKALDDFEQGSVHHSISFRIHHGSERHWQKGVQTWKTAARILYTMSLYCDALRALLAENEGLLAMFEEGSLIPEDRASAVLELRKLQNPSIRFVLTKIINDPNPSIRDAAVNMLNAVENANARACREAVMGFRNAISSAKWGRAS